MEDVDLSKLMQNLGAVMTAPLETVEEAVDFLDETARELLDECLATWAGELQVCLSTPNATDYFRLRDYSGILDGLAALLRPADIQRVCELFLQAQLPDGTLPEAFAADGTAIYGSPDVALDARRPATDFPAYAVNLVWHAYGQAGDIEFIRLAVPRLIKALRGLPRNERTELICVEGPTGAFVADDFTPGVHKQGDLFLSSLLFVQACQQLADLMQSLGQDGDADMWRAEGQHAAKRIRMYFWDKKAGLFRAAGEGCRQLDLWGSALSVYLNLATSGQLMSIGRALKEQFSGLISSGQVRHLLPGEYWDATEIAVDCRQNGGFWLLPSGWVAYALDIVAPELAGKMILELSNAVSSEGVHQWHDVDGPGLADHLPSLAAVLAALRRMQARRQKRENQDIII